MFLRIHIDLTPVVWTHTLSHVTVLRAQASCAPGGRCDLRLRNGAKIADYELALTILNGEMTASNRQKYALVEEANGWSVVRLRRALGTGARWRLFKLHIFSGGRTSGR